MMALQPPGSVSTQDWGRDIGVPSSQESDEESFIDEDRWVVSENLEHTMHGGVWSKIKFRFDETGFSICGIM